MEEYIIKILSTAVIAVFGWVVAHYFTSRREVKNKQREIKVAYLIKAYQKLENCIQRDLKDLGKDLESTVANIQLFGSEKQIKLTKKIANDISKNGSADLESLLKSLRTDLRKELQLSENDSNVQFLRMQNT
jgi:uridine kinase